MRGFISTLEYTKDFQTVIFFRHKMRLKEKRTISEIMEGHWGYAQEQQYETEEAKEAMYERKVSEELKGRYFITLYARRCVRRIHGINFRNDLDTAFMCKGQRITFREYYEI
eukprot:305367_1